MEHEIISNIFIYSFLLKLILSNWNAFLINNKKYKYLLILQLAFAN